MLTYICIYKMKSTCVVFYTLYCLIKITNEEERLKKNTCDSWANKWAIRKNEKLSKIYK